MTFIVPAVKSFGITYFILLRSVKGNAVPGPISARRHEGRYSFAHS